MSRTCNCYKKNMTEEGECIYGDNCRRKCIVYRVDCKDTGKYYIGSTANDLKTRMKGHFNDVKQLLEGKSIYTDTFARHFTKIYKEKFKTGKHDIRKLKSLCKFSILWEGNPLSVVGKFGSHQCKLCSEEKLAILFNSSRRNCDLLNKCGEIYRCCRHKGNFHRYVSTDELMRRKGIWFEMDGGSKTRGEINTKMAVRV